MFHRFSQTQIFFRRIFVLLVGLLAFPVMLFRHDRARFYSYLHRVWSKTSTKPVWLKMSERGARSPVGGSGGHTPPSHRPKTR